MKKKKLSLEQLSNNENKIGFCIFKSVISDFYKTCKICDGYNYNCESYETIESIKNFKRKDLKGKYKRINDID